MKDNNISNIDNSDIEDILKSKMNELSDSVDCFDRISEKVFSADEDCFFKDGYVVDGVEVVTSKPRISPAFTVIGLEPSSYLMFVKGIPLTITTGLPS